MTLEEMNNDDCNACRARPMTETGLCPVCQSHDDEAETRVEFLDREGNLIPPSAIDDPRAAERSAADLDDERGAWDLDEQDLSYEIAKGVL